MRVGATSTEECWALYDGDVVERLSDKWVILFCCFGSISTMAHQNHLLPSSSPIRSSTSVPPSPGLSVDDMVADGSVDLKGKRAVRAASGGWSASLFIIGVELSERIAYYGIASNLIIYLTTSMHEGLASAVKNTNNWLGFTLISPFVAAFLADAYWGRYWTIASVSLIYVLGLIFLTLSVSLHSLQHNVAFFFCSLYMVAIGTGGVKPCLEAFGADQFDDEDPAERTKKSSFFNWWYFGLCTGGLFAITVLVYIEDNVSWGVGFGIPAAVMAIALLIFMAGTPFYRHKLPGGSPLSRIAQVLVAAVRKRKLAPPSDEQLLYEDKDTPHSLMLRRRRLARTKELLFLDKAAIINEDYSAEDQKPSPWKLCSVTQVEEVKLVLKIVPVWLTTFTYGVVFAQTLTLFTKQGSTLDRHLGHHFKIPAASFQCVTTIVVLLLLPLYDKILVPVARAITGHQRGITILQRVGVGLFISIFCMVAAALAEKRRIMVVKEHGLLDKPIESIPLTIFWLLPQYILFGIADVFALVGQQEFFYDQMPDSMRSLGMALYLGSNGVGYFVNSLLITIVNSISKRKGHTPWIDDNINRSHLDYYFWFLGVLSAINFFFFILVALSYKYKKVKAFTTHAPSPCRPNSYELGIRADK